VTVASTGGTPSANFTFTTSGLTATFTDSSTDSGGTIGSHSWNFGDSSTSTATSPSHTYAAAGTYNVSETVTDSVNGTSSTKSSSVMVSVSTSQQLLVNGTFETTGSWTASTGVLCPTGCSGETAHSGSGFAWLDGYGSTHTDTLSQTVTIPAGKSTGTLSFYLHIDTAETTTTTAYDKLTVQVGSTTVATFSNLNKNTGYAVHTYNFAVTPGSSVTVKFTGTEDSSLQTSFVIDDATLTVQ
jgi:PKD repeat protein